MSKFLQKYLRFWAKIYLRRAKPKIVAITGSVGKTSTKEAIFEVLKIKYTNSIRKSEGNLNNETGAPLAILGYKSAPTYGSNFFQWFPIILSVSFAALFGQKIKILVLELAADKPGDIRYLTDFIKPDIACITNIGPAHLEAFGTMEKIIDEKTSLLKSLPQDGFAVLNIDDENLSAVRQDLKKYTSGGRWETLTFAIQGEADIMARNITTEISDTKPITKFQIVLEGEKFRAETYTLGRVWNVYAALAGVAVATIFEMKSQEIAEGLKNIKTEKHRMEVLKGINNSLIIDDCYNANPVSMKAALDILKDLPKSGRKIAVLGGMREIGKITDEAHEIIGQYANEIADEVIAVGELAKKYNAEKYFDNTNEASEYILEKVQKGDIILIKASRAIALEKIADTLKASGLKEGK